MILLTEPCDTIFTENFPRGFNGYWTPTDSTTNGREAYTMYNEELGDTVYLFWSSVNPHWLANTELGVDWAYVYCDAYEITDCVDGAVYDHDGTQWIREQDAVVSWQSCTTG